MSGRSRQTATIDIGATASDVIELRFNTLGLIVIPDALTGTEVALEGSFDAVLWWPLCREDGTPIVYTKPGTLPAGVPVDAIYTYAVPFARLVSDATQATADAVFLWGSAPV